MSKITKLLDQIEARAENATGQYGTLSDCWQSASDVPALVQALRFAAGQLSQPNPILDREEILAHVAAILSGSEPK